MNAVLTDRTETQMVKHFSPTNEMKSAALNVFACMAAVESIRPVVEDIHTKVLEKKVYRVNTEWRGLEDTRVRDMQRAYLMSEKDYRHYLTEVHAGYKRAGFNVEFGYCPLLIAEHELINAQHLLIDAMEPVTGMSSELLAGHIDERKKFIDLTLRLLAAYVKP